MSKKLKFALSLFMSLCSMISANAAFGSNAAPFDLELGVATKADVEAKFNGTIRFVSAPDMGSLSKYCKGAIEARNPEALSKYGIDDASEFGACFDSNGKLNFVLMTVPRGAKEMFDKLSKKYEVSTNEIDSFMDEGTATFKKGNSIILINSPHMRFDMDVVYLLKSMSDQYSSDSKIKKEKHDKNELDNL